MIRFLQPWWLLALVPVAAVAVGYVLRQRTRRVVALRFSTTEMLRAIAPQGLGWRRHLAPVAFLACLTALATAMARPATDVRETSERATVLLAIDVSLSMAAEDVPPTRLRAAQDAAADFVGDLPAGYNVGLVTFARSANVTVPPSKDRDAMIRAIAGLTLAEATATGEAVFTSLEALRASVATAGPTLPPARIVLLSDGYRTTGRSLPEAATAAAAANVPVSTIAFGTDAGVVQIEGRMQPVAVDRRALAELAAATGGRYYEAVTAGGLSEVYADLGSSLGERTVAREVGHWYAGVGLLFGLLSATFGLLWTSRLP
ncbi:VWA domain-containing protein [Pilimelia columellifera]|uniref:VWA domain-containing protein n=1 Tax=Pilimelia columellifera TaxID=706574 RepID=UPI0031DC2D22